MHVDSNVFGIKFQDLVDQTTYKIECWLETMRGLSGYSGPLAHWWRDCLHYTGAGLDWRYEGIIAGYLNLYERTGFSSWLGKAQKAADDLVAGQLPDGNYRASSFEANPKPGGTPHEAACDLALIRLAQTMRERKISGWEPYAQAAERNIHSYILGQLWVPGSRYFCNLVDDVIFVPNKAATIVEALLAWVDYSDEEEWLELYVLPTLERICSCQIQQPGSRLDGAIDQAQGDPRRQGWFYPFYNARCIPALTLGYRITGQKRYLETAVAASEFILRVQLEDGSFPQVVRLSGRTHRYPQWVAGVGDILRGMSCLAAYHEQASNPLTLEWMLQGLLPSGGICTAHGFARRSRLPNWSRLPDFRDLLPAAGWVDKAFRFLTTQVSAGIHLDEAVPQVFEQPCQYRGRECIYYEDRHQIEIRKKNQVYYRWRKGADWAEVFR